jgi:hypothetical protein
VQALHHHIDSFTAFLLSRTRDVVATKIRPAQNAEAQRMDSGSRCERTPALRHRTNLATTASSKPIVMACGGLAMPRLGAGDFTVHGMRSAARSWMADNDFEFELAEACLAHVVGNREVGE